MGNRALKTLWQALSSKGLVTFGCQCSTGLETAEIVSCPRAWRPFVGSAPRDWRRLVVSAPRDWRPSVVSTPRDRRPWLSVLHGL
ncbi:hypothetical protein QE152_g8026 [Popillia japonica]|uniref:Uncharacterized protein n=1 Tax=Popillia japonica TaxID=7064 RepID=A0AAW1MDA5_POPJA